MDELGAFIVVIRATEIETAHQINQDDSIDVFAELKARRVKF